MRARARPRRRAPDGGAEDDHAARGVRRRPRLRPRRRCAASRARAGFADVKVRGEELLANWFGWANRTLEATADPETVPWGWHQYAYRGYLALQQVDRALLEPRLPAGDLLQPDDQRPQAEWLTHGSGAASPAPPRVSPRVPAGGGSYAWQDPAKVYLGIDPATYLEVSSGYSTTFAARAKADGGLATRIVSIDPEPRAEIDQLCDEVVRERVEATDLSRFDALQPGDVVFFDGSHRVFMDNDVSAFFIDVLPRLHPEVLVGVHDIYLPDDYFPHQGALYWTEQYLLAVALLAGGAEPVLPCHHVCVKLADELREAWEGAGLAGINAYGSAFWLHPRMNRA